MVEALLLMASVLSVCQILSCGTVTRNSTEYVYPPGSLSCKLYNRTSLDCSYRNLVSIPPLQQHRSLEKLDLSHNKLSYLPVDAFRGLHNLKLLDLSNNKVPYLLDDAFHGLYKLNILDLSDTGLKNITGSPFRDLASLQELDLSGSNEIESINNDTFAGLEGLDTLHLWKRKDKDYRLVVYGSPFIGLQSLRVLSASLVHISKDLFTGLEKLAVLKLDYANFLPNDTSFDQFWSGTGGCSLRSLHTFLLMSYSPCCITNKCFQNIPLKTLHHQTRYGTPCSSSYEYMNNLTSLNLNMSSYDNCTDAIPSLSSGNSILENLTIFSYCRDSKFVLDATTFSNRSKWSSSLRNLDITSNHFQIEGSPFACFTTLRKLRLTSESADQQAIPILTLSRETFSGLENLQELSLNVNFDVFTTNALHVFNHLKHLELQHDQINSLPDQQFSLSSITELDLSDNSLSLVVFPHASFPNLRNVLLRNNDNAVYLFYLFCKMSPYLYKIDLTGSRNILIDPQPCLQLVDVHLSESTIIVNGAAYWPHVKSLYMQHTTILGEHGEPQPFSSIKQMMVMFDTPDLTTLDFSSNQIKDIDKKDAMFLRNLTYLNLANNELTTLDNLQYLTKINMLILNGNRITAVAGVLLSRSNSPFMDFLDLRNNPFVCTCVIDAFRKWILQDDDIYLIADNGSYLRYGVYQCLTPDSMTGLSLTEIDLDCRSPLGLYLSISMACAFVALLMAISVIQYRWHIQYQLFLLCTRRKRYQHYLDNDYGLDDDDENENGIPRFDAYVAYHEEDEDWVDEELLQNIEEGDERFRLCLRSRDVPAGRLLINAVSMCIQRSRKTLIILTPRFVENNWCYFQLSMAHQRLLDEGRNVLILIILEEISNDKMTLILRQLFCKVRCLKWPKDGYGQRLFWRRLKEELKRPMPIDRRYHI